MTAAEEREIIRVCGPEYGYYDIPPAMRRNDIEVRELAIPICQPKNNYASAAADYQERIRK